MPYSQFTLSKAVDDFQLIIVEGDRFLPEISPVDPSSLLRDTLRETVPWAIAVSSEKARSEGIINPVLLEVKRQLHGQISVFSGEEFNVQPDVDLTGYVDLMLQIHAELDSVSADKLARLAGALWCSLCSLSMFVKKVGCD